MTTARGRRISDVFDSALLLPANERPRFLAEACAGDEAMREEIEARLAEAEEVEALEIEAPFGIAEAARQVPSASLVGRRLGAYRIDALLGSGGMGEVYRAHDEKLGRDVAIKILRNVGLSNPDRLARFEREARVLATLNHPHIAAIYGVDDSSGIRALVLELVEGPTIADRVARGPLPIKEALAIAKQIAEALEAAHERRFVHRDLKPANIKMTLDGVVKVLDFGLAKIVRADTDLRLSMVETHEGVILGTVVYMSPEQARGQLTDKRTDIWSFGCVLYEMLTGRQAFIGETSSDVIAAVLDREPDWTALPARTPANVRHLLQRCLQKDPRERLRDIGEARIELHEALAVAQRGSGSLPAIAWPALGESWRRGPVAAVIVALIAIAGAAWYWAARDREAAALSGQPRQLTAAPGWEAEPALSPDGSFIAYSSNESGNADIWIIDAQGGNPLRLTTDDGAHRHPAWFPDGSAVAFAVTRGGHESIWKVPRLGGAATLIVADGSDPAISPDGSQIAFSRAESSGLRRIAVAPIEHASRATLLTGDTDGVWDHVQPAWSPDGRSICYATVNALWIVAVDGGRPRRLTTDDEFDREPVWSANGRFVYFSSFREGTEALWRVAAGGGRPVRVTMGTGPERQPSTSRDGTRLAYSTMSSSSDVALLDLRTGRESQVPGERNEFKPTLAPDGHAVAFASDRWNGRLDIWVQPLKNDAPDGSPLRLTDHPGLANYPAYSPDGHWIAYSRVQGDRRDIWIIPTRGGMPAQITEGPAARFHPSWSPDGSRVAFGAREGGTYEIQVVPVADGRRTGPLTTVVSGPQLSVSPVWSPDGSELAYVSMGEIWRVGVDGAREPRRVPAGTRIERVRWNRVSGRLFASGFWGGDRVTIRVVDLTTGASVPLPFAAILGQTDTNVDFDMSGDERLLAFDREALRGAIWVLENKPRP